MSEIKARVSNFYGGPPNGSQVQSMVGQTPLLTMDGNMDQPRGRATIMDAQVDGGDVYVWLDLPDGTKAGEIGSDAQAREVALGYITETSRTLKVHTVAHASAAPRDEDVPLPEPTAEPVPVTPEEVYQDDDATAPEESHADEA